MLPAEAAPLAAESASADTAEARRRVLGVVERLMHAMEVRDTALLGSLFVPGARLLGMRPKDGGMALQAFTVQQFAKYVANDRRERWMERAAPAGGADRRDARHRVGKVRLPLRHPVEPLRDRRLSVAPDGRGVENRLAGRYLSHRGVRVGWEPYWATLQ